MTPLPQHDGDSPVRDSRVSGSLLEVRPLLLRQLRDDPVPPAVHTRTTLRRLDR